MPDNEKQFESDIEAFLISGQGGWTKDTDTGYRAQAAKGLDLDTLVDFVRTTQPKAWGRFERQCNNDASEKFYREFDKAVQKDGMLAVLRHGFSYRNFSFRACHTPARKNIKLVMPTFRGGKSSYRRYTRQQKHFLSHRGKRQLFDTAFRGIGGLL